MQPIPPFWFVQRQAKMEPVGENMYRITAPNLREAVIAIGRRADGHWSATLRLTADGPEVVATPAIYDNSGDAWSAAFELYRTHVVV